MHWLFSYILVRNVPFKNVLWLYSSLCSTAPLPSDEARNQNPLFLCNTHVCHLVFFHPSHGFQPPGGEFQRHQGIMPAQFCRLAQIVFILSNLCLSPPPTFSYQATRPRKLNGCVILEIDQTLHGTRVAGAVPGLMCLLQLHTDPFPK